MPYTYLIGWSDRNMWYYGVRYGKNCHPDDLWRTYFTSSKPVKRIRELYGDPDIIQIRKVFDSVNVARLWEHKTLRRLRVVSDNRFINQTDNISICKQAALRGIGKFRNYDEVSKSLKQFYISADPEYVEEVKRKRRDGIDNMSADTRKKMGYNSKKTQYRLWSDPIHTAKRIDAMRKPRKEQTCPHCNHQGRGGIMKRWHFDNCKLATR